jgi:hypothetical protein
MKFLLASFAVVSTLIFTSTSFAADKRVFSKINADEAEVKITTESTDTPQAAMYVDGVENKEFISMMLSDAKSQLATLAAKIAKESCDPDDKCGDVELTSTVLTAFNRGGWQEGHGERTFFVGFRYYGSGLEFSSSHMVTFSEDVVANVDQNDEYVGTIKKSLKLIRVVAIP